MKSDIHNEVSFTGVVKVCWERKWLILILTVMFGVVGIVFSYSQKTMFKTEVALYTGAEDTIDSFLQLNALLQCDLVETKISQIGIEPKKIELTFHKNARLLTLVAWDTDQTRLAEAANSIAKLLVDELESRSKERIKKKLLVLDESLHNAREKLYQLVESTISDSRKNNKEDLIDSSIMEHEISIQENLADMLVQQKEELKLEVATPSEIIIIDKADTPKYPDRPKRKLIIVLSFIIGFWLGVIIAVAKNLSE